MRRFFLGAFFFFIFLPGAFAIEVPDRPLGRIHDQAGLLNSDQRSTLESKLAAFESSNGNQIVVATFPSLDGESLEDFSIRVAQSWKLGQKNNDNGILLFIAQKDRALRIEVGYGLEAVLTDALSSQIIRKEIVPHFKDGNFDAGVSAGVEAIMQATQGAYKADSNEDAAAGLKETVFLLMLLFFVVFVRKEDAHRNVLIGGECEAVVVDSSRFQKLTNRLPDEVGGQWRQFAQIIAVEKFGGRR